MFHQINVMNKKKKWGIISLSSAISVVLLAYFLGYFNHPIAEDCSSFSEKELILDPYFRAKRGLFLVAPSQFTKTINSGFFEVTYRALDTKVPRLNTVKFNCSSKTEVNEFYLSDSLTLITFYDFNHRVQLRGILEDSSTSKAPTLLYPKDVQHMLITYGLLNANNNVLYGVNIPERSGVKEHEKGIVIQSN